MKLDMTTLAEGSTTITFEVQASEIGPDPNLPEVLMPVRVEALVFKRHSQVLIEGKLETVVKMVCSRCLESAPVNIQGEIRYDFRSLAEETPSLKEEEIKPDELDVEWYEGVDLDLNDPIRQSLILSLPMRPLCSEQCLGLCPNCGSNLNLGKCQCREEDDSNPFRKLKGLKFN